MLEVVEVVEVVEGVWSNIKTEEKVCWSVNKKSGELVTPSLMIPPDNKNKIKTDFTIQIESKFILNYWIV